MPEKKTFHNVIGGEVQASADGAMMDIVNPSTRRGLRERAELFGGRRRPSLTGSRRGVREVKVGLALRNGILAST